MHAAATASSSSRWPQTKSSGDPSTGVAELNRFGGLDVGIWEMTPGVMRDVEAEEVFVVLCRGGDGRVRRRHRAAHPGPGDVVQLTAGAETVWTVRPRRCGRCHLSRHVVAQERDVVLAALVGRLADHRRIGGLDDRDEQLRIDLSVPKLACRSAPDLGVAGVVAVHQVDAAGDGP